MQVGDIVELTPIGLAKTNSDGTYEVEVDPSVLADHADGATGVVNFDILVPGEAGVEARSSSAVVEAESEELLSTDAENITVTVAQPLAAREAVERSMVAESPNSCGWQKIASYKGRQVVVGQTASTSTAVTASFTIQSSATSKIGAAAVASSGVGWQASGTSTVSTGSQTIWSPRIGAHSIQYRKQQDYGKFKYVTCGNIFYNTQVRPVGNMYGSSTVSVATPTATRCASNNATIVVDAGRANTFGGGVSMSAIVGINLSAETGYSSKVAATYKRTSGSGYYKPCGQGAMPENSGQGQLVAKP